MSVAREQYRAAIDAAYRISDREIDKAINGEARVTDIVKELRSAAYAANEDCNVNVADLLEKAAGRIEKLREEMDKLWSQFVVQCESIEDRAEAETAVPRSCESGFYAGEKYAAKSIRRSVPHPRYNEADYPAYNGEA